MSSFIQADIFFFITSVAVVAMTIIGIVAGVMFIKILNKIKNITDTINDEVHQIKQDIDDLRAGVRDKLEVAERSPLTSILGSIVAQAKNAFKKPKTRRASTRKPKAKN